METVAMLYGHLENFTTIWYIWYKFLAILYIFSRFGMFGPRKMWQP
jgi:hypothetical protein